jgi:hypothetical protein
MSSLYNVYIYLCLLDVLGLPSQSPSKGSQSVEGLEKLREVVQNIVDSNITLEVNGKTLLSGQSLEPVDLSPIREHSLVQSLLSTYYERCADKMPEVDFVRLLSNTTEATCQDFLNSISRQISAVDTSTKSDGSFLQARTVGAHPNVYPLTAKFDLLFTFCRGRHEFKATKGNKLDEGGVSNLTGLRAEDTELLVQMLWREYTDRNCCAYYSTTWTTGCTARSAWLVMFERDIDAYREKNGLYEKISFTRITHETLPKLWTAFREKSRENPDWYYTRHAPYLLGPIGKICDARGVITQLIAKSTAFVYSVSFTKKFTDTTVGGNAKNVLGATAKDKDMAIKVVECDEDYLREVAALRAIVPQYNALNGGTDDDVHYALGYYTMTLESETDALLSASSRTDELSSADELSVAQITLEDGAAVLSCGFAESKAGPVATEAADSGRVTDGSAAATVADGAGVSNADSLATKVSLRTNWDGQVLRCSNFITRKKNREGFVDYSDSSCKSMRGGSILMRPGDSVSVTRGSIASVISGITKSLRCIHDCGFCHRDVRLGNMLKFGNHYQLIDFGLSGRAGEDVLLTDGGRLNGVGCRLSGSASGRTVSWVNSDDYDMLLHTVVRHWAAVDSLL